MIPEEELRSMYWDNGLSSPEIAEVVGVDPKTIRNWMREYGIPIKSVLNPCIKCNAGVIIGEELYGMYWDEGMSKTEIAESIGVSCTTIRDWMNRYNIPSRTRSESYSLYGNVLTKEELHVMYWDKGMSMIVIGKIVGVDPATIRNWMKNYGIETRSMSEAQILVDNIGPNSPVWKGGPKKYCYKFNNRLKEAVRDRDGYTCQNCGKTQEENIGRLCVHHIHYDAENCYPDLISLCTRCHMSSNSNRDWWETHYMCILAGRGLLEWKPAWVE